MEAQREFPPGFFSPGDEVKLWSGQSWSGPSIETACVGTRRTDNSARLTAWSVSVPVAEVLLGGGTAGSGVKCSSLFPCKLLPYINASPTACTRRLLICGSTASLFLCSVREREALTQPSDNLLKTRALTDTYTHPRAHRRRHT